MSIKYQESKGSIKKQVASGTTASIVNGTPVMATLGSRYVSAFTSGTPIVGTDIIAGFAQSNSNETTTASGSVDVEKINNQQIFLGLMDSSYASTITTQAQYNALVGKRVVFGTATINGVVVETIMATDGATHGLVIEDMDYLANPGKVAYSIRTQALSNY